MQPNRLLKEFKEHQPQQTEVSAKVPVNANELMATVQVWLYFSSSFFPRNLIVLQASDGLVHDAVTAEPPQRATNEHGTQQALSQRAHAAVKYFEAVVDDADLVQRVSHLLGEMMQSMGSAGDDTESFTVWSDIIAQELLDTRFFSSEVRDLVRDAGHAAIMRSINESLLRATSGELEGCVSISHSHSLQSAGDNEAVAHDVISGHDFSVL